MDNKPVEFDVVVIGGGPAGSCAALRLLSMGHRVALIEQEKFPRPQIGESLTYGIQNIFNYLQADELLHSNHYLHNLSSSLIWETKTAIGMTAEQRGEGVIVDRGKLDSDLVQLAIKRGLITFQPAMFESCYKSDESWIVTFKEKTEKKSIKTIFVLDARGRKGVKMHDKVITAPASIVLYANTINDCIPHSTIIEAKNEGWLWGSPLPDNKFRMMAFLRPEDVKGQSLKEIFKNMILGSVLFKPKLNTNLGLEIQTCLLQNYCHSNPWQNNYIRLGETAFTLDPLSSTGVEKAMRLSLQAVIAVNTILRGGNVQMAKGFFEDKMAESISTHRFWTRQYYASAWPGQQKPFWKERSQNILYPNGIKTDFYNKLLLKENIDQKPKTKYIQNQDISMTYFLTWLWHEKVRISNDLIYIKTPCIINDQLEIKNAIKSAGIEKEIAYLEQVEITPMLAMIDTFDTMGNIIYKWSKIISFEQAKRIALGLWNLQVICRHDLFPRK